MEASRIELLSNDQNALPKLRLEPGEIFIGNQPAEVYTLLGSCVAVTIFHPRLRLGAICHARLASRPCSEPICGLKICQGIGDYTVCSIRYMLACFDQRGALRRELEVKLFGGANMFGISTRGDNTITVGRNNVDSAMEVIRQERLHLLTSDVGGNNGRTLFFNSAQGTVRLKRLNNNHTQG